MRRDLVTERAALALAAEKARQVGRQPVRAALGAIRECGARRRGRHRLDFARAGRINAGSDRLLGALRERRQAMPLLDHPVVVEAGEQLAAVERERGRAAALAQSGLESGHVALEASRHDAHTDAIGVEHRPRSGSDRLEDLAQAEQGLAQPVAPGVDGHAGPEQLDQLLARMLALRMDREAGEEEKHAARAELHPLLVGSADGGGAEQSDVPRVGGDGRAARGRNDRCHGARRSGQYRRAIAGGGDAPDGRGPAGGRR